MSGLARLQADNLARTGRYGDTMLLHVSPSEVQGLDALAKSIGYDGLTTNPTTGLKEAFLFAPLLAPLLAGGLGGLSVAGSTALGTGLLAGGLGAAEAAARGMDDPLKQGLMAGITAGGLSAIGGAASAATGGADAATGMAGGTEALAAGAPSATTAPVAAGTGIEAALPTAEAPAGAAQLGGQGAAAVPQMTATPWAQPSLMADMTARAPQATPVAGASAFGLGPAPSATGVTAPPGMFQRMGQNLASAPGRIMDTGQKLFENPEMMSKFMSNPATKTGAMAAMSGMMGSAGLEEQARAEEAAKKEERAGAADMQAIRNRIIANYAAVGRQAPWMAAAGGLVPRYQEGGEVGGPGRFMRGEGDGMSDGIQAVIDGRQPAALADGEFVIPADVVSALGNGSSEAGARVLEEMMRRVRMARTGTGEQAPEIEPEDMMPEMEGEEDED